MRAQRYKRIVATLSRRQPDLTVAMENVHKTRNLGAIARTCDAVGIGRIHAIAPADARVRLGHKSASGTERWLELVHHSSAVGAFASLREAGFTIVAADVGPGTRDFRSIDYVRPTALVLGSERDGLSADSIVAADVRVRVPLVGMVESLNVSVAIGVILYEALRQRELAGCYSRRRIDDLEFSQKTFEWLHPRIAAYCRSRKSPYPPLDRDGEILERVTKNRRDGFDTLA